MDNWWDVFWRYGWIFAILAQLLLGWVGWSMRKQFVTAAAFKKFADTLREEIRDDAADAAGSRDRLFNRVTSLEIQMQQVATIETVHDLQLAITRLEGTVSRLNERLDGSEKLFQRMERVLDRQEEYLLNSKGND